MGIPSRAARLQERHASRAHHIKSAFGDWRRIAQHVALSQRSAKNDYFIFSTHQWRERRSPILKAKVRSTSPSRNIRDGAKGATPMNIGTAA